MNRALVTIGRALSVGLTIASLSSAAVADSSLSPNGFPFQEQAFRVRLQPNFFKVGSDLFEDILRSSEVIDNNNTLRVTDKSGNTNYVHYSTLKTSLRMEDHRLIAAIKINIVDAELFSKDIAGCSVMISGPMGFATVMDLGADTGAISVDVPAELFDGEQLTMEKKNCGILGAIFGTSSYIRESLVSGLKESLGDVINSQEFKMVSDPKIDSSLKNARVFLNIPSAATLSPNTKSNFGMAVGVHGSLSGARNGGNGLHVVNSRSSQFLSGLGLEWTLDTGFKALSQNIYDPSFRVPSTSSSRNWPEWGKAPFTKLGNKVDFDAGIMIRGTFLKSLFTNLYRAGFFNLQLQDSILNKKIFALNPISWKELFDITLPNGQPLNQGNYRDMRIETVMSTAPEVTIRDSKSIDLIIPDLTMKLSAQSNSSGMFEVLTFRARFHVVTMPELDENGQLALRFNEQPVEDFQLVSRSGVGRSITDEDIKNRLNQTIVAILKQAKVEIPLMKNKKITIPYMGIDGDKANGSEALAVYLKVK